MFKTYPQIESETCELDIGVSKSQKYEKDLGSGLKTNKKLSKKQTTNQLLTLIVA